nr:YdeI/OmpD-associated family protein [uncultured Mucilaginibacter sp.]
MEELKNGIKAFYAPTQAEWRNWLMENHEKETSVWLILYKKDSPATSIPHTNAVDEALCFGWIDSLTIKRDEHSRYQLFSKRKPKGNWSAINKAKALRMIQLGLMTEAGSLTIAIARANGMWDALNDVENLIVPQDLQHAFEHDQAAWKNWETFPPSSKKAILKWLTEAKKAETRAQRVTDTISAASANRRIK